MGRPVAEEQSVTGRIASIIVAGLLFLWSAPFAAGVESVNAAEARGKVRSVEQYGITWQFSKPACVGRYVTGDFVNAMWQVYRPKADEIGARLSDL
ncbi:MAG: hypothetical protein ACOX1P_19105 [Thermoguttaceae bacterium]